MKVNYLGPVAECADHPAIQEMPVSDLPCSSFLVEVAQDAGIDGELMEGDVLVADENRITEYGDVVLACDEYDEMRAYHSHRVGGYLRLVPMGGGEAVPASALDCVGVVVRRGRNPANDIQLETPPMAITLAEAFEPWYCMSTWYTRGTNNDKLFYQCCYEFFQVHGERAGAEEFREHLRDAIPRRGGGNWLDEHEKKLSEYATEFEVIFWYLSDTGQISSRN